MPDPQIKDEHEAESVVLDATDGRGADAVIDAVGMEAHGSPLAEVAQTAKGFLPPPVGRVLLRNAGVDRLAAFNSAISVVRRGGTVSLAGVYGGATDPINMCCCSTSRFSSGWGRPTSSAGCRRSCRC